MVNQPGLSVDNLRTVFRLSSTSGLMVDARMLMRRLKVKKANQVSLKVFTCCALTITAEY